MRANRIPSKAKRNIGKMIIDFDGQQHPCPFEAENDFEEAFLHYLATISNTLVDIEAATSGVLDNAVVHQLCKMEDSLSSKLESIVDELRRLNGCTCGRDAEVMALRLLGESAETFSPECFEVMHRWQPKCKEILSNREAV